MMLIKNGRVIDPESGWDGIADLLIEDGKIKELRKRNQETTVPFREPEGAAVIDAEGLIVAPGLVDVHVHFRDPGFTYKEDILTGAEAAKAGGYTTVVCMANTKPSIDNAETLQYVLEKGRTTGIHVLAAAAVTKGLKGQELTEMEELAACGAAGFTDDGIPLMNETLLEEAMERAKKLNLPISLHEEDPAYITNNGINRGAVSERLKLGGSPAIAEESLVERDCRAALRTGARINIQHISSGRSVRLVAEAKAQGADVWAEVTPHHFTLDETAVLEHGTLAKMNPPLRTAADREALITGLKNGWIDMIATDHAPHSAEEKERPLTEAPSGIIGLETALSLAVTKLVKAGHLSYLQLFEKLSLNPARLYHLSCGRIKENEAADLVIFDDKTPVTVTEFHSKSANSPFIGETLTGQVKYTICQGAVVYEEQKDAEEKPKEKTMLKRGAGLLMPISSLPSPYGIGTFGKAAYEFADQLKRARQSFWQVLPMGPTSYGDSPYQSFSAFAGNPYFIDLDTLKEEGLLTAQEIESCFWCEQPDQVKYDAIFYYRFPLLRKAFERSAHKATEAYEAFLQENAFWIGDYSLYMALKKHFEERSWMEWDEEIRYRKEEAVKRYEKELELEIDFWKFLQFKFFEQWNKLKKYVNDLGIKLIGDIPIYVALDGADVWSHPEGFQLNPENLTPLKVAGVPPDAFSADGQLWGNPLYDWKQMEQDGFGWWRERMKASARLYDVIRIDHFIGVVQYYAIPYGAETAREGQWEKGPGRKLTRVINASVGNTKIIAEDLGIFCQGVKDLLAENGYPGMKIIEFAFSGDRFNEHLPHCYEPNTVVYGGTHDNETLIGYFKAEKRQWWELQYIADYLGAAHQSEVPDRVFRAAYSSVASVAIFQMQDVLKLDNWARMNTPGTVGSNWRWRMKPGQFGDDQIGYLAWLVDIYGRFQEGR